MAINRLKLFVSRIIPGDWGKAGSGWLTRPLLDRAERHGGGGEIHQFLWHVRTCQMRMRDLAARSDEKLLRTESSSPGRFRAWANRSYPEGIRLQLCISTGRATLAVRRKPTRLAKPSKGGQNEGTRREEHADQANPVKNFRAPAMLKTTSLDCEQKAT